MSLISQDQYEEIISWYQKEGQLVQLGCVPRSAQQLMVDHICHALDSGNSLLCEAPTGVGKTFSYLFPLGRVLQSRKAIGQSVHVVISTATKNLQKQLANKDFPSLQKFFPDLKTHVWMGASNYLCGIRLYHALQNPKLDREVREELQALSNQMGALKGLPNGWREELPMPISDRAWEEICGDTKPCCHVDDAKTLKLFCHKRRAFMRACQADILCVNHSLLCNLAIYTGQIHPGSDDPASLIMVIDEAHELEDNLRRCLNQNFNLQTLRRHLRRLTNPADAQRLARRLENVNIEILSQCGDEPSVLKSSHDPLVAPLRELSDLQSELSTLIVNESSQMLQTGMKLDEADYREIMTLARSLNSQGKQLQHFLDNPDKGRMLEVGRPYNSTKESSPFISFASFEISDKFTELWKHSRLNILTSATLFNTDEDKVRKSFGLPAADTAVVPPSFDYKNIIRAFAAEQKGVKQLSDFELAEWIKAAIDLSAGNALVLFTSYKAMELQHQMINNWCQQQGYQLLVQARNNPPSSLVEALQNQPNSVVFGTSSLWTGIDVKGTNLSNVIITKLPFRMVDNFAKQYSQYLESKGENAFSTWSIPDMISRTRQGMGRLIRDASDKGLLFVLDPRFTHSAYARQTQNHILPDEEGQTVLQWQRIRHPSELPPSQEIRKWLGVSAPSPQHNRARGRKAQENSQQKNLPF